MSGEEDKLPQDLLHRASAGNEYAWRVDDIPEVIEAARAANLASVGGQLQFRLPAATCECYWVEVDTYKSLPEILPWPALVKCTADTASDDFKALAERFDFLAEGRSSFPDTLGAFDDASLREAMWFVWYLTDIRTDARARA